MSGVEFFGTSSKRCFSAPFFALNLDWSGLFWLGVLILLVEGLLFVVIRLKHIYLPTRFLLALMIVSAVVLAELLPYLFLSLTAHPCMP